MNTKSPEKISSAAEKMIARFGSKSDARAINGGASVKGSAKNDLVLCDRDIHAPPALRSLTRPSVQAAMVEHPANNVIAAPGKSRDRAPRE
jgi:hypothetical protein